METQDPLMQLSVEQFEQLILALKSQDGSYAAILVFSGILAFAGIILVMWWVLNLRLAPIEKLCESLTVSIKELNDKVTEISTKIWAPEALDNKIKIAVDEQIKEHVKNCPYKDSFK